MTSIMTSKTKLVQIIAALCLFLCLIFTAPALHAQTSSAVDPADQQIESQLEIIFEQTESFEDITVDAKAGVVTLSGTVPNDSHARQALKLAADVSGVLTVNDEISRTLALSDNLAPMWESFQKVSASIVRAIPLIAIAFLTFLCFVFLGNRLVKWNKLWQRVAPNPFLADIIGQAVRIGLIVLGIVLALKMLGADELMATILGGAGVIGLAIGFAVRDTIENYISSIMLSIRQPFRANDHVKINNHEGKVVRLTSRATILMTMDGNHLRIPNATVFKAIIMNYSRNPDRRFSFELGVDADDDPIEAMDTALAAISKLDFLLDNPKPGASIKEVGGSNIVLKFSGWVNQNETSFGKARSHAIRTATSVLVDEGFTMPEPIYRLKLDERAAQILTQGRVGGVGKTAKKTAPAIAKSAPVPEDMTPETHLDERVNEERISEGKKDLLDSGRPIE